MVRKERPRVTDREISSRSSSVSVRTERWRDDGLIPPVRAKTWRIEE
jgi:hypothetical protein